MKELSDARVTRLLTPVVATLAPIVPALAYADPLGVKAVTYAERDGLSPLLRYPAAAADLARLPGTRAWSELTPDGRARWWARLPGSVGAGLVAAPGGLGALTDRLGVQDALGFANQFVAVVGVAHEHGVSEVDELVALVGTVLLRRELPVAGADEPERAGRLAAAYRAVQTVRAVRAEFSRRPQPAWVWRWLGSLPVIGVAADFIGECGAVGTAVEDAQAWLGARAESPSVVSGVHSSS